MRRWEVVAHIVLYQTTRRDLRGKDRSSRMKTIVGAENKRDAFKIAYPVFKQSLVQGESIFSMRAKELK